MNSTSVACGLQPRLKALRYDLFKGVDYGNGMVRKVKSVGAAVLLEGHRTYMLYLDMFVNDVFHLMPASHRGCEGEFAIMSRKGQSSGKAFWRAIGYAKVVCTEEGTFLRLKWDLLGVDDIYMNTAAIPDSRISETNAREQLLRA